MSTSELSSILALCFAISTAGNLAAQDCDGNGIPDANEIAAGSYLDSNQNGTLDSCEGFSVDVDQISLSQGGYQRMHIDLGPGAAYQTYRVLGSLNGSGPGMLLGPVYFPLAWDGNNGYMIQTLKNPNSGFMINGLGYLDSNGQKDAWFSLPAGMDASLAGLNVYHAFVILSWDGSTPLWSSNSVRLELTL